MWKRLGPILEQSEYMKGENTRILAILPIREVSILGPIPPVSGSSGSNPGYQTLSS